MESVVFSLLCVAALCQLRTVLVLGPKARPLDIQHMGSKAKIQFQNHKDVALVLLLLLLATKVAGSNRSAAVLAMTYILVFVNWMTVGNRSDVTTTAMMSVPVVISLTLENFDFTAEVKELCERIFCNNNEHEGPSTTTSSEKAFKRTQRLRWGEPDLESGIILNAEADRAALLFNIGGKVIEDPDGTVVAHNDTNAASFDAWDDRDGVGDGVASDLATTNNDGETSHTTIHAIKENETSTTTKKVKEEDCTYAWEETKDTTISVTKTTTASTSPTSLFCAAASTMAFNSMLKSKEAKKLEDGIQQKDLNYFPPSASRDQSQFVCTSCGTFSLIALPCCSICKKHAYCNKKCQKDHWKSGGHRKECKMGEQPLKTFKKFPITWDQLETQGSAKGYRLEVRIVSHDFCLESMNAVCVDRCGKYRIVYFSPSLSLKVTEALEQNKAICLVWKDPKYHSHAFSYGSTCGAVKVPQSEESRIRLYSLKH